MSAGAVLGGANLLRAAAQERPALLDAILHEWVDLRLHQGCDYEQLHRELEGKLLATLLPRYGGKPTLLARALNMNRATLRKRLRDHELGPDEGE